jgi:hypothetical protein
LEYKHKILTGIVAATFVLWHTVAIVIYAMPTAIIPAESKSMVSVYVNPVFDQKWNMFAPCPIVNGHFEMKYFLENGDSTLWISPADDALKWHRMTRFMHYGELVLVESNIVYWLNVDMEMQDLFLLHEFNDGQWSHFKEGYSYLKIVHYAKAFAVRSKIKDVSRVCVRYNYENVKTKQSGWIKFPEMNL